MLGRRWTSWRSHTQHVVGWSSRSTSKNTSRSTSTCTWSSISARNSSSTSMPPRSSARGAKAANAPAPSAPAPAADVHDVPMPYPRRWLPLPVSTSPNNNSNNRTSSITLKVVSYNLLAQGLVRRDLYPYASDATLKVARRKRALLDEMLALDADIVCFQECDHLLYVKHWCPALHARGYASKFGLRARDSFGATHSNNAYAAALQGTAVFYRSSVFEKVAYRVLQYADLAEPYWNESAVLDPVTGAFAAHPCSPYTEMNRPNVAQLIALRVREGAIRQRAAGATAAAVTPSADLAGQLSTLTIGATPAATATTAATTATATATAPRDVGILLTNTHLFWNPKYAFVRLKQVHMLMSSMCSMNAQLNYLPLMCGDWNMTPDSVLYRAITSFDVRDSDMSVFLTPEDHGMPNERKVTEEFIPGDSPETFALRLMDPRHQRRVHEVKELLASARHFPRMRSVYQSYADVVPEDVREATRESYGKPWCRWTGEPPFTNYTEQWKGTIDYIFVAERDLVDASSSSSSSSLSSLTGHGRPRYRPTQLLEMLPEREVSANVALPNLPYCSDHLCVACTLDLVVDDAEQVQQSAARAVTSSSPQASVTVRV